MKKLTALILVGLMIVSLSGCSPKAEPEPIPQPEPNLESEILDIDSNENDIDEKLEKTEDEKPEQNYSGESPSVNENPLTAETAPNNPPQQPKQEQAEVSKPTEEIPKKEESSSQPEPNTQPTPQPQPELKPEPKPEPTPEPEPEKPVYKPVSSNEMRAVWISYLDLNSILKGKSKSSYTSALINCIDNMKNSGFNTVVFQVRPFSDALYPSDYFPWSSIASGVEGESPGFDPLQIAVDLTHNAGMRFEAWINPYRIRTSGGLSSLSSGHIAKQLYNDGSDAVISFNGGVYYNPASTDAQKLIVDGVREIVKNYKVDGIHFDDYFYPTTDASFDSSSYNKYKNSGGKLALADWRRENVNKLVFDVYSAIKSINSSVDFGISPQGNMNNNYNAMYIDVEHWVSNKGYVDYIMPQIYFGFENSGQPYSKILKNWHSLCANTSVDLCIGLAPYKIGVVDSWAGDGKNEWINNDDILQRMVLEARKYSSYGGFALFRYDSVYKPSSTVAKQVKTEMENLEDIM